MMTDRKYWAQDDAILMADFKDSEAPVDEFKKEFFPLNKKQELPVKPTEKWMPVP